MSSTAFLILLLSISCVSHEICNDLSGALPPTGPHAFCLDYEGRSCCKQGDIAVEEDHGDLGVSGPCGDVMRKVMCTICDPWAGHLWGGEFANQRTFPFLCSGYCTDVYTACRDDDMVSNPFDPQMRTISLGEVYPDSASFCAAVVPNDAYCYDGAPYDLPDIPPFVSDQHRLCTDVFIDLGDFGQNIPTIIVSPPDNSDRLFIGQRQGFVSVRSKVTGAVIAPTFLDISNRVATGLSEQGLIGMAFHPQFAQNGKFYIHYTCDTATQPDCRIPCTTEDDCYIVNGYRDYCIGPGLGYCNTAIGGDQLSSTSIISELQLSSPSDNASPSITTEKVLLKIFNPWQNHNAGKLVFGPEGYLYIPLGDGGAGDSAPQSMGNFWGKMLRIDVNNADAGKNYAVPQDNPWYGQIDKDEIFALGLRNPWQCSFDSGNPSYFFCGDVAGGDFEEVNLISAGHNYGWPRYEGNAEIQASFQLDSISPTPTYPTVVYPWQAGTSVIGGFLYRGDMDNCTYGRYVFADWLHGIYSAVEYPAGSGLFESQQISLECSSSSPLNCQPGGIFTITVFGEDPHSRELYFTTGSAIRRIVDPNLCSAAGMAQCPTREFGGTTVTAPPSTTPTQSGTTSSQGTQTQSSTSTGSQGTQTGSVTDDMESAAVLPIASTFLMTLVFVCSSAL